MKYKKSDKKTNNKTPPIQTPRDQVIGGTHNRSDSQMSKITHFSRLFCAMQYLDLFKIAISILGLHKKLQYFSLITKPEQQISPSICEIVGSRKSSEYDLCNIAGYRQQANTLMEMIQNKLTTYLENSENFRQTNF